MFSIKLLLFHIFKIDVYIGSFSRRGISAACQPFYSASIYATCSPAHSGNNRKAMLIRKSHAAPEKHSVAKLTPRRAAGLYRPRTNVHPLPYLPPQQVERKSSTTLLNSAGRSILSMCPQSSITFSRPFGRYLSISGRAEK